MTSRPFRRCANCRDKVYGKERLCSKCKGMLYPNGRKAAEAVRKLEEGE